MFHLVIIALFLGPNKDKSMVWDPKRNPNRIFMPLRDIADDGGDDELSDKYTVLVMYDKGDGIPDSTARLIGYYFIYNILNQINFKNACSGINWTAFRIFL